MKRRIGKLAIHGGKPILKDPLPMYRSMGQDELKAVVQVVKSGCLSGFYGSWNEKFYGGPKVKEFEQAWCERFKIRHVVSVNSATSGLIAAMGAIGLSPGDEVIVPPFTMSATVLSPLIYGAIPVFADIEPETFCLDPRAVRRAITPRTRAILAVNLFGHPAPLAELMALACEHRLKLVEDNAQSLLAMEHGRYAGTIGHIGVFSLNCHKHIHTGEGGMCVTDDDDLAQRLQLIRNHGENVVEPLAIKDITNLVGFNFRMTELSAAVGLAQLKRVEEHVGRREAIANGLSAGARDLAGLIPPLARDNCRHVYYVWVMRYDESRVGVSRERFCQALEAEGFPNFTGYTEPLYLLPVFQQRKAIGREGYPFNLSRVSYEKGLCPVAERMHEKELLGFQTCMYRINKPTLARLVEALRKVYEQRQSL